jgi:hypothetical protein
MLDPESALASHANLHALILEGSDYFESRKERKNKVFFFKRSRE